jgi:hypothetical protein
MTPIPPVPSTSSRFDNQSAQVGPKRRTRRSRGESRKIQHTYGRADVAAATTFSVVKDASVSQAGWHGALPPELVRRQILTKYKAGLGQGQALRPIIAQFFPVRYDIEEKFVALGFNSESPLTNPSKKERSVLLVDAQEQIFLFRSYRAGWLQRNANQVKEAIDILTEDDLLDQRYRSACRDETRGPHMPIIIGDHRQSAAVRHFHIA